jgi:tetratricopeptide (TPR) repeat protein
VVLAAPQVEIAGCEETLRTPATCRPAAHDSVLRLFVPGDASPEVDAQPGGVQALRVQALADEGFTVTLQAGPRAETLVVRTPGAEPWRIALDPMPAMPAVDELRARAAAASDAAALESLLPRVDALVDEVDAERRVDALRLRMLIDHQLGRSRAAETDGEAALEIALDTGRVGAAIRIAQVLAWQHLHRGDDAGARWLVDLQTLYGPLELDATNRAGWHYYRGLLARQGGDLRTALSAFEAAETLARRLGDGPQELSACTQRVVLLGALGRSKEQREGIARVLRIVETPATPRCEDALELDNVAWALLSDHGTRAPPPEVDSLFDRVEAMLAARGPCNAASFPAHAAILADVGLGRALAALGRDDRIAARTALADVAVDALFPAMPPWLRYAEGLLALREGRVDDAITASAAASRAALSPGAGADPDPRLPWRLALLRGHAHAAAGHRDVALGAFLDAERIVDRLVGAVGVDQGREGLAAQAHEGAAQAIEIFLADGRVSEAAALARRSRSRTFRPIAGAGRAARLAGPDRERFAAELDAYRRESERIGEELKDAWRLDRATRDAVLRRHAQARARMREHLGTAYGLLAKPGGTEGEALSMPAPGELWLLWHPRADGWAEFAITAEGVRAKALPDVPRGLDPKRASELLLVPFDAEIEAADSVLVLPIGALLEVDFAGLLWNGDALLSSRAVAWKLDVPRGDVGTQPHGRRALVVGDPATRLPGLGRLAEAAREAEAVAKALGQRGFTVTHRWGDDATAAAVIGAIAEVDLLHWAGHGRRGDDAWDSRLPLAGEAALDLRDVLALATVPSTVVLTGCETGRVDRGALGGAGGMHLAAGFVVSGARLVVAANDEVDDALARELGTSLYTQDVGLPDAGIEGVRRAALALRRAGRRDWTAFRAWVP